MHPLLEFRPKRNSFQETKNTMYSTFNIQHSTLNTQHSTLNIQLFYFTELAKVMIVLHRLYLINFFPFKFTFVST
jgi:hypothetical protein